MRVVQVILVLTLLLSAHAAWGQNVLQDVVATDWAEIWSGDYVPASAGEAGDYLEVRVSDPANNPEQAHRSYLEFPKIETPAGHELASAHLFLFNPSNGMVPVLCQGLHGWDLSLSAMVGLTAPLPSGPAAQPFSLDQTDRQWWYDVTTIVGMFSGEDVYLVLSPNWTWEEQLQFSAGTWLALGPAYQSPRHQPRIVYTFMESGVKRIEVSVGALKAGYGSE